MLMLGIMYMASLSDPANSLLDTMSSELMGSILLGRRLITSIPLASTSLVSQGAMEESCEVVVDVGATFEASQCHKHPSLEHVKRWLG